MIPDLWWNIEGNVIDLEQNSIEISSRQNNSQIVKKIVTEIAEKFFFLKKSSIKNLKL